MKGLQHWLLIGTGGYSTLPKDLMQVCGTSIIVVGTSVLVQASQRVDKSEGTIDYIILQVGLVRSSSTSWPEALPVELERPNATEGYEDWLEALGCYHRHHHHHHGCI